MSGSPATNRSEHPGRTLGLVGATGVGVGAIVGGGILVLAGVAFERTGPSAIIAFAVNGVVAVLTALSFAEMASAFPQSGGAYVFAKKVLTVRAAFAVGWVLWFAYIVAAVLYALGFAEYGAAIAVDLWRGVGGEPPAWIRSHGGTLTLALASTGLYVVALVRKQGGGGQWETLGKLVLFVVLIAAGGYALAMAPSGTVARGMTPFLPRGISGLAAAMGFTFIALQGFDLIAAVGGEVKQPAKNIPKAMLLSLGIALAVYLPLLFIVATVGTPEGDIGKMSARSPATVMADAAQNYAGGAGYWMVMLAAVLATLSALAANLLAASHVAITMAQDRTLPRALAQRDARRGTPVMAVLASGFAVAVLVLVLPDVSAAGAAASLIFLIAFALVHWTSFLARRRAIEPAPFRTPWFPAIPLVGGLACTALALFQGFMVPVAGAIAAVWLALGVLLYLSLFAGRAQAVDAFAEALDPHLATLRGRRPLVLVPLANPANAARMAAIGNALAAPGVGRVVLLNVLKLPGQRTLLEGKGKVNVGAMVKRAEDVVREALSTSIAAGHAPETLLTIAADPWEELVRVVNARECESLLIGLPSLEDSAGGERLELLLNRVDCDVTALHARPDFELTPETRIVVAVGGRGSHDDLRARLLGSLGRVGHRKVRFVRVLPSGLSEQERADARAQLAVFAEEETGSRPDAQVIVSDDVVEALAGAAGPGELLVLGLQQRRGRRILGTVTLEVARATKASTILISRG